VRAIIAVSSLLVEIAPAQPKLFEHCLQQAFTDLFPEILKRRLTVSVVQRPMTALAVAPVEADDDTARSAEPRDLAEKFGPGHGIFLRADDADPAR